MTPAPRRAASVALVLCASLALAACNNAGTDDPGEDTTPTATASGTKAVQPSATGTATTQPSASASSAAPSSPAVPASTIANLDAITVDGAYGKEPKVTAKWPIAIAKTQVKVLSEGKGGKVAKGGTVVVNYAGINARTGKAFDSSFAKGGKPATFPLAQVIPGFRIGLEGQKVGSRVLIMMTPKDGYAEGNPQAGILKTDPLVFVVDIIQGQLEGPEGAAVPPKAGLPTVKDNGKGKAPTITTKGATIPKELTSQLLIKGTGPAVKKDDGIVVNYTVVGAKDGKVLAENYSTGAEAGMLNALIPGWQKGLVNQPAGSRVLLVVPPADGYPKGNATPSIPANETLVYVIDILFASAAN